MKFISYIPNGNLYSPRETSKLASQLNNDAIAHYHRHIRSTAQRVNNLNRVAAQASRQQDGLPQYGQSAVMHPFKIYQFPNRFRAKNFQAPFYWRTFRVRNGLVLTTNALGIQPTGTDLVDDPYEYVFVTKRDGTRLANNWNKVPPNATDIEVPDNTSKFWFWVELAASGTAAVIRYGPDPTVASYSDGRNLAWTSTNKWTTFPATDGNHFPLGYVDTLTGHASNLAHVRQYWRTDILGAGGGAPCPYG